MISGAGMFELTETNPHNAVIKVIGVGGGGGNAIENMIRGHIEGVEFICANTDAQALRQSSAQVLMQLGDSTTKGLGAGANPEVGRQAAEENEEHIREILRGSDMVFITAGMGGGTGTGAAPVFARIAKELGILTVAVVTRPFGFEGKKRFAIADAGIREISKHVDSLITIPNNKLLSVLEKNITLLEAFKEVNNVLLRAVQGITELITRPGLINVDFADVRTVMSEMGMAMMGIGSSKGESRAERAAEAAISNPLLDDIKLDEAKGILVNITANGEMTIDEFVKVGETIRSLTSDDATVVIGTVIDPTLADELRVTVVATGLGSPTVETTSASSLKILENIKKDRAIDYNELDRPPLIRRQTEKPEEKSSNPEDAEYWDYFDIPAVARRHDKEKETIDSGDHD